MIILAKPYISDYLIETIKKNNYVVLDNEVARQYFAQDELISTENVIKNPPKLIYSNSENSIEWVSKNLPKSNLAKMIEISKNKVLFREKLKPIYPNYYFKEVSIEELKKLEESDLNFPLVLKPTVGFLSFGVYPIKNITEWKQVMSKLDQDIEHFKGIFPTNVVDTTNFLIEEMIEGEEYAIDAYFDENGEANILNIYQHPFFNEKDVSDRVYYSSKAIMQKYLKPFKKLLNKIGKYAEYKNFPFHLELRANEKDIIPIELNPMRMCGWCITDIAQNTWGINVYEYFMNQIKPDWENILKNHDDDYYYFTIGEIPSDIDRNKIKSINIEKYRKIMKNPLVIREIDYKVNPVFAICFAKTPDLEEIKSILSCDMHQFIEQ